MTDLAARDVEAMLALLPELYGARSLAELGVRALRVVGGLVPADLAGYDQIDMPTGRIVSRCDPGSSDWQAMLEVFAAHHADHPCKNDYERTGNGRARLISDFQSVSKWEATGLFNACYRPLGLRDQLSIVLTQPVPGQVVVVTLNRARRGFVARDKAVLDLLRPHLMAAYDIARRFDQYEALAPTGRLGVVRLRAPRLAIAALEGEARAILDEVFPGWGRTPGRLPPELAGPLAAGLGGRTESGMPGGARRFALTVRGRRLDVAIRLASPEMAENGPEIRLLLEQSIGATQEAGGRPALSRREADIRDLLPLGLSNKEIALRLDISAKTVGKHLENIFAKLGVRSRAAVVAITGR